MAATFNRFRELPRELRDQIWTFAIRNSQPGVHIFRIYNTREETHTGTRNLVSFFRAYPEHRLAEPSRDRYFHSIDVYCSESNVSTYLIDGGLWTVCKESRLIMEKKFRSSEWDHWCRHRRREWYPMDTPGGLDMPATGYLPISVRKWMMLCLRFSSNL